MSSEDDTTLDGPVWELLVAEESLPVVVGTWGAATSRGLVRERNEDSWASTDDSLFVVADGMGGYPGGDAAAEVAVRTILAAANPNDDASWTRCFARAAMAVRLSARQHGYERSGAAVLVCAVWGGSLSLAYVGDVRAYRLRGGVLDQLTFDHSVEQALLDSGRSHLSEGRTAKELKALTRYLGGSDEQAIPTVRSIVSAKEMRLILCTDGVYGQLEPEALLAAASGESATGAAHALVGAADRAGGRDNATAICLDFVLSETTKEVS